MPLSMQYWEYLKEKCKLFDVGIIQLSILTYIIQKTANTSDNDLVFFSW